MCGHSRTFIRPKGGFHTRTACNSLRPTGPTGFRCISSGTSLSACIDILAFIGICKALKLHFYLPKERNEISERYIGSTAADAAVISRRMRGSMNYTGKPAYEICPAGQMKAQLTLQ